MHGERALLTANVVKTCTFWTPPGESLQVQAGEGYPSPCWQVRFQPPAHPLCIPPGRDMARFYAIVLCVAYITTDDRRSK